MAATEPLDTLDIPESASASADRATPDAAPDVPDDAAGGAGESVLADEEKPPLARRIADAFREGVASARPDYVKSSQGRIPPTERKPRPHLDHGEILDQAVEHGRSAAEAVRATTAVALDYAAQLARRTPAATQKFAQAFREGAASVKRSGAAERKVRVPQSAGERPAAVAKAPLAGVSYLGAAAKKLFAGVVTAVKPGAERSAWRGIRLRKRRITALYMEIGREAVSAWGDGPVATEKLTGLLDELRKNEEDVQRLRDQIAAAAAERTARAAAERAARAARSQKAAPEVVSPDAQPAQQAAKAAGPAPEYAEVAEEAPQVEASAATEQVTFDEPAAIQAEEAAVPEIAPAPEHAEVVEAAQLVAASVDADQTLSAEPGAVEEEAASATMAETASDLEDDAEAAPQKDVGVGAEKALRESTRRSKKKR